MSELVSCCPACNRKEGRGAVDRALLSGPAVDCLTCGSSFWRRADGQLKSFTPSGAAKWRRLDALRAQDRALKAQGRADAVKGLIALRVDLLLPTAAPAIKSWAAGQLMIRAGDTARPNRLSGMGSAVKALGDGRIGGHLVLFGEDLEGDTFSPTETDFAFKGRRTAPVHYHHGQDETLGLVQIGESEIGLDSVGVWIEAQLARRSKYRAYIDAMEAMTAKGLMGWSSGVPLHRRRRLPNGKHVVTYWPLGSDASLTPIPADVRNVASLL